MVRRGFGIEDFGLDFFVPSVRQNEAVRIDDRTELRCRDDSRDHLAVDLHVAEKRVGPLKDAGRNVDERQHLVNDCCHVAAACAAQDDDAIVVLDGLRGEAQRSANIGDRHCDAVHFYGAENSRLCAGHGKDQRRFVDGHDPFDRKREIEPVDSRQQVGLRSDFGGRRSISPHRAHSCTLDLDPLAEFRPQQRAELADRQIIERQGLGFR